MENLFWKELHKNLKPYLRKTRAKRVRENLHLALHGKTDEIKIFKRKIKAPEDFLMDLLYNYSELSESLKRFKIISILINQYPKLPSWDSVGLNKTVYLRYHYETFLHEAHLYRERMCFLLKDLEKKCKQHSLFKQAKFIKDVSNDFLQALQNVSFIRNYHVHKRRFRNNKIDQLADLELFVDASLYYKKLRDREYKQLRLALSKQIKQFAKDLEELQNKTLARVHNLTFIDLRKNYN
jgi:hypothetical protein